MFIRIPGTIHEGDDAQSATSHPTLEAALSGLEELGAYETVTVLDTATVPLAVAAFARAHRSRTDAEQARAKIPGAQLVPGRSATIVLAR